MRSGFFNSNITGYDDEGMPIYDRAEEASFFAQYFANFIGNGIYPNPSNGMQVVFDTDRTVKVSEGYCFIKGYLGIAENDEVVLDEPDTTYARIDRIVARLNIEDREITIKVKKGTPSAEPVPTDIERNSNIYELALADIRINKGATSISQANITDMRLDNSVCGIVTGVIDQVDTTTLFNQYLTWFEEMKNKSSEDYSKWFTEFTEPSEQQFIEWFNKMKDQLTEDAAAKIQTEVNTINKNIDEINKDIEEINQNVDKVEQNKVDKVDGKGLSANDFTDTYKSKLDGIATGATKNTVENSLSSTSTANALSAAQGKVLNDKYNGTSLYDNSSGTTGTITLSQSAANFSYLDIYFITNNNYLTHCRVYSPNGKTVSANCVNVFTATSVLQFALTMLTISGTSVTFKNNAYANIVHNGETIVGNVSNYMKVIKVVGYK